jgi:hypothetical protein
LKMKQEKTNLNELKLIQDVWLKLKLLKIYFTSDILY